MKKMTFAELRNSVDKWSNAVVVFKPESFSREFSELARSYQISSDAKYFNPNMGGNSLFGNCLDGTDNGVRLDWYMHRLPNEGTAWAIEYCYIID